MANTHAPARARRAALSAGPTLAASLALLLAALLLSAQVSPSDARRRRSRGRGLRDASEKPESVVAPNSSPSDVIEAVTWQAAAAAADETESVTMSVPRSSSFDVGGAGGGEEGSDAAADAESVSDVGTARSSSVTATATSTAIADATSAVSYVDSSSAVGNSQEAESTSGANAHARAEVSDADATDATDAAPVSDTAASSAAAASSSSSEAHAVQILDGGSGVGASGSRDATTVLGHGASFDTAKSAGLVEVGPPVVANANSLSPPIDLQHTVANQFSLLKRPPGLTFPSTSTAHGIHGHALQNIIAPVDCSQDPGTTKLKISCTPGGPMLPPNPYFYEKPILLKGPRHTFLSFKSKLHTPSDDAYALPITAGGYGTIYDQIPLNVEPPTVSPVQGSGYANALASSGFLSPLHLIPSSIDLSIPMPPAYLTHYVLEASTVPEPPTPASSSVPERSSMPSPAPAPAPASASAQAPTPARSSAPAPAPSPSPSPVPVPVSVSVPAPVHAPIQPKVPVPSISNANLLNVPPLPERPPFYCSQVPDSYGSANVYDYSGELSTEESRPIQEPPPLFMHIPFPRHRPAIANTYTVGGSSHPRGESIANANAVSLPNPNALYGPIAQPHAEYDVDANAVRPNYGGGYGRVSIPDTVRPSYGGGYGGESIPDAVRPNYGGGYGGESIPDAIRPNYGGGYGGESIPDAFRPSYGDEYGRGSIANANAMDFGDEYKGSVANANAIAGYGSLKSGNIVNANDIGFSPGEVYKASMGNSFLIPLQEAIAKANAVGGSGVDYRSHIANANAMGHMFPQRTQGSISNANTVGHTTGFRESIANANAVSSVKGQQNPYALVNEDYDYEYDTSPSVANSNEFKGKNDRYILADDQGSEYGVGVANLHAVGLGGSYGSGGGITNINSGSGYPDSKGNTGVGYIANTNALSTEDGFGVANANAVGGRGSGVGQVGSISNTNLITKAGHAGGFGENVGNLDSFGGEGSEAGYAGAISNGNALGGEGYGGEYGGNILNSNTFGGDVHGGNVNDHLGGYAYNGAGTFHTNPLGDSDYGSIANSNAHGGGSYGEIYGSGMSNSNSLGRGGYGSGISSANTEEGSFSNTNSLNSGDYGSNVMGVGLYGLKIAKANVLAGGGGGYRGSVSNANAVNNDIAQANAVAASTTVNFGSGLYSRHKRSISSSAKDDFGDTAQDSHLKTDTFKSTINNIHKIQFKKLAVNFADAPWKNLEYPEGNSLNGKDQPSRIQVMLAHHVPHHIRHQAAMAQLERASKYDGVHMGKQDVAPAMPTAPSEIALADAPRAVPLLRPRPPVRLPVYARALGFGPASAA